MITVTKTDGITERKLIDDMKKRAGETDKAVTAAVSEIIDNVRKNGDAAVFEYTLRWDGCAPEKLEVPKADIEAAVNECDPEFINSLKRAAENIRDFHSRQIRQGFVDEQANGVILGQRVRGLAKVGIYVPGGTAAYPSSVLMNAVPAKIAGVGELIMATPPLKSKDGSADVNKNILAAAAIAGVDRVFMAGGAQAIAALAYGTQSIPKVDKIVGPGNIYVATAKRMVFGAVDIDMIAGPSEILIIADETANPAFLAADLMSQAEHDALASCVLLTTSQKIADETVKELQKQVQKLERSDIIKKSLKDHGMILVCAGIDEAFDLADEFAPEHLELAVKDPLDYLDKVKNAGSVFLGNYSPEPLGDYYAGPNHVLPTGGTARFFSPLSVDSFIKKSSFIYYTKPALESAAGDIIRLAEAEGLTAHANSVRVRL